VADWLTESLDAVRASEDALHARWSAAGRRLGERASEGRGQLLLAAIEASPAERHVPVVAELYRTGELREQEAVLRALPRLPAPERFVAVGIEAVRQNAVSVIEAIACDNPYPARHFPEEAFNQMVLKCLFNGLALGRIVDLGKRRTPELQRMVAGYASERRAAGRTVPDDVDLILGGTR
jgi:hypothetical protein